MRQGKTLQEMAAELERQKKVKRDFVTPSRHLEAEVIGKLMADKVPPTVALRVNGYGSFGINSLGHEQIAGRLGIPKTYYDRMKADEPALLASNVNTWLQKENEKRMVRTLDGNVRAFLSDRYRPLDNFDLADVSFETLIKNGVRVESTELTERRLYIKAVTERIQFEVKKGDVVQAGIVISNSEVGAGSVKVEPLVFRLVCTNGLISNDHSMRKYHVGRAGSEGDFAAEFFKDETRMADDRAFWMKVRDVIEGAFRQHIFEKIVQRMRLATEETIEGSIEGAIELTQAKLGLSDTERGLTLRHLIEGADLSRYGLMNAITRTAQDIPDYDRSTELERMGSTVLELPKMDWEKIANAKVA